MVTSEKEVPPAAPGPSFGEELRKEREIRGISLAEIAEATKVSRRFLGAIENDDFATLPAPVFTRGFIREYARYLGLNAEEMVTRYSHFLDAQGRVPEDVPVPLRSSDRPHVDASGRGSGRSALRTLLVFLGLAALAAAGWFAFTRFGPQAAVAPAESDPVPVSATPTAEPTSTPAAQASLEPLSLKIRAVQDVWIVLHADGQRVLSGTMRAGEERAFSAAEQFEFETVGNARGVAVTLNGIELPPLGSDGQIIRDRVYTREDANVLMRTPATSS